MVLVQPRSRGRTLATVGQFEVASCSDRCGVVMTQRRSQIVNLMRTPRCSRESRRIHSVSRQCGSHQALSPEVSTKGCVSVLPRLRPAMPLLNGPPTFSEGRDHEHRGRRRQGSRRQPPTRHHTTRSPKSADARQFVPSTDTSLHQANVPEPNPV